MANRNLTLKSSNEELKAYFEAICKIIDSKQEEFPVNLDDVWPLVYGRKEEAVRALTTDFQYSEDVDYKVLRKNAENHVGGRPTNEYHLSVSCLEHFIARKKREVFEVYRQFFHGVRRGDIKQTLSRKELALMVIQQEEEKERLMLENKAQAEKIEADAPKVLFAEAVETSDSVCLVGELAKILKQNGVLNMGQNRLYKWLRSHNYLGNKGDNYNLPTQKAMDLGVFKVIKGKRIDKHTGGVIVTRTAKVTTKGLKYFINKFINVAAVL